MIIARNPAAHSTARETTRRPPFRLSRATVYILVIGGAVVYAMPFIWMLSAAVRSGTDIAERPIEWFPRTWAMDNFTLPWDNFPFATFRTGTTSSNRWCT